MAVTILFDIDRAADFKSITVTDDGTVWGAGEKAGTTSITLNIYGTDKVTALKSVLFTSQEQIDYLAGSGVTFLFIDSRLWETTYAPDNFYTGELIFVNTEVTPTSSLEAFDSYFYIQKIIMEDIANVAVPLSTAFVANSEITGNIVALDNLQYLSDTISIARESKWRQDYSFLSWNYANDLSS
jgi:hypothetical protein